MRTSILTFEDRARARLCDVARHASLKATDDELKAIHKVVAAVNAGLLSRRDAHKALAALQTAQQRAA